MRHHRALTTVLATALLLVPGQAVVAQDPSPSAAPTSRAPEATETSTIAPEAAELLALFPTEIAGQPIVEQPLVIVGEDLISDLDPENEDDARELTQVEVLLEAAGATIEDVTSASVFVELASDEFALLGAFRIEGSDAQTTLDIFAETFALDVDEPVTETVEIGGREARQVSSAADPEGDPFIFLFSGDVTWVVVAPEEVREEIVSSLP